MALIVGLQTREDDVELLFGHGGRQRRRGGHRISGSEGRVFHMQRPIGATGERFANHLLHARGSGRTDDDFAAVLFAQPQPFFQRIGVGLVHFVADVLLADPRLVVVQTRLPLASRDLLDADGNLHWK